MLQPPFAGITDTQIIGKLGLEPFDRRKTASSKKVQRRVTKGEMLEDILNELCVAAF